MSILGVVHWTNWDKSGNPIAGVRPLVEIQKSGCRQIDPYEEFPTQGQVFWPNAQAAAEGTLITFRAEPNSGQKDEYRVTDPWAALEVLDLRGIGTPTEVRAALANGIRLPGLVVMARALIWCKSDVLVGPVDLSRMEFDSVKLSGKNLARVPTFTGVQPLSIVVNGQERMVRIDDGAPSGYVDWDDDATVLRRALEAAVRIAKKDGRDSGQTKKQIEEAAHALASQGIGIDSQLDRYRLERALSLFTNSGVVAELAPKLVEVLREHPAMKAAIDELSVTVRANVEQATRAEFAQTFSRENTALKEATEKLARTRSEVTAGERDLLKLKNELDDIQRKTETVSKDAEAAIDARVLAALERPMELLGEASVLRPLLLGGRSNTHVDAAPNRIPIDWSRTRGEPLKDRTGLQRALTSAARARGIDPSLMAHIHAAIVARLMPVTLGSGALAALVAYAHAVCGGRLSILHISPAVIQVRDLNEASGGGLLAATEAAKAVDGVSLVVLEGANRAPLEASVVPLLQLCDIALSDISTSSLRIAATLVAGATTVPVSSQLWSHAVAIHPEPTSVVPQNTSAPNDIALSSDLLATGDVPTAQVEELIDVWPDCAELRPTLERFGAALSRLYDGPRITDALLHGLVLPHIVTALNAEEQDAAISKAGGSAVAAKRLRRRLC